MQKKSLILLTIILLLVACSNKQKGGQELNSDTETGITGEIQLSGAFALYPMVVKWAEEFKKKNTGVRIDISGGGAGKGMTDVLAGVVDIGMVSREIYQEEIAKGAFGFATVKDAVIPTINAGHPDIASLKSIGLKKDIAKKLWNGEFKTWGQALGTDSKIPVHVFTRSDACGAGETFAAWLNLKQENLRATAVFGDPGVADAVRKDKVSIGYNNIAYVYDQNTKRPFEGLDVIPLDVNENGRIDPEEDFYQTTESLIAALNEGKYPSPPARDLYLVTKGKPIKPEVIAFLEYVLTEGQQFAKETGYIGLSQEELDTEIKKLK
jgi:phosphate transport system substrate-binding protein